MRGNWTLVALMFALVLVVPLLGCSGYGVLLHTQVVELPQVDIWIGRSHIISVVSPQFRCLPQHCNESRFPPGYSLWLFIDGVEPRAIPLVRLPLR
jgi:hypothetical protein